MKPVRLILIFCLVTPVFAQNTVPEIPFETVPNF